MSPRLFRFVVAVSGILSVVALMVSFSINPGPPPGATVAQVIAFGKQYQTLILAGSWLQGVGSLLQVIFILALVHLAGATSRMSGKITTMAAIVIVGVSLAEASFYISAVQGGVSGNMTVLSVSLVLIQAIQHAYVISPAPALMLALGIVLLTSRQLPAVFGYLALLLGAILGILGLIGMFLPLQTVINSVLSVQELWFAAVSITLIVVAGKASTNQISQEAA